MTDVSKVPNAGATGQQKHARRVSITTLVAGLMVALVSLVAASLWVLHNAMSHSGLGAWWLLYTSSAGFFISTGFFVFSGTRAARLRRSQHRFMWLTVTAYVFGMVTASAGVWLLVQALM